jgi:hypothetical protein
MNSRKVNRQHIKRLQENGDKKTQAKLRFFGSRIQDPLLADYVMVDSSQNSIAYNANQLENLLESSAVKNGFNNHGTNNLNDTNIFKLYCKNNRDLVLFNIVNNTSSNCTNSTPGNNLMALDNAFEQFQYSKINADLMLIPVVDIEQNYYRLLAIDFAKKTASYYDARTSSFLTKSLEKLSFFKDCNSYIEASCKKFFPEHKFQSYCLGHQTITTNMDSSWYIAEYANLLLQDKPLQSLAPQALTDLVDDKKYSACMN